MPFASFQLTNLQHSFYHLLYTWIWAQGIGIWRFRSVTWLSFERGIRRFKNGIRRSSLRIHFHPLLDTFKNDLKKLAIRGKPTILWFSTKKLHYQTGKSLRVTGKKESEKSVSINPSKLRGKQGCNSLGQVVHTYDRPILFAPMF